MLVWAGRGRGLLKGSLPSLWSSLLCWFLSMLVWAGRGRGLLKGSLVSDIVVSHQFFFAPVFHSFLFCMYEETVLL